AVVCDTSFYSAPVSKFWGYLFGLSKLPELGKTKHTHTHTHTHTHIHTHTHTHTHTYGYVRCLAQRVCVWYMALLMCVCFSVLCRKYFRAAFCVWCLVVVVERERFVCVCVCVCVS